MGMKRIPRAKHRLPKKRMLRRIFRPKTDEVTVCCRKCIMRSSTICTLHQILLVMKSGRMGWGR